MFLLGFESFQATGRIAQELTFLSDAGLIRVIDVRFLLKETEDAVVGLTASELDSAERAKLRDAAGALVGLGTASESAGEAPGQPVLGPDAALGIGGIGLTDAEIRELAADLEVGDAVLLLVIENVWASGLAQALRDAGIVYAKQDYVTPEGLVALGAMIGAEVARGT